MSFQARLPLYYEHGSGPGYVCIAADKALFGGIYYELAELSGIYVKQVAMPEAMGCLYGGWSYWLAKAEEGWYIYGQFNGRTTQLCKCASSWEAQRIVEAVWRAQAGLPPAEP